jgi:hypothetical protein
MAVGKVVATVVAAAATIMTAFTTLGATTNTRVAKSLGGNGERTSLILCFECLMSMYVIH